MQGRPSSTDIDPDTMRFPREAPEEIQLPPPAETTGRTFIGPAPAPRPGRRKPSGTSGPQTAVTAKTNPFAPVSTEVIAPELIAAAIAAEAKVAAAAAAAAAAPAPEPEPAPAPDASDTVLSGEPFELEPVALDAGTLTVELGVVGNAPTEPFLPGPAAAPAPAFAAAPEPEPEPEPEPAVVPAPPAPSAAASVTLPFAPVELFRPAPAAQPFGAEPAPRDEPMVEEPRVVFHPERLPIDIGQTDPDLPPPAQLAPEQIAAAVAPTSEPLGPELLQPGTLVDEYELVGWLASDPTGTTYTAHDSVEQPFAIKVVARGMCRDEASLEKLVHSARSSRQLDSVHLVEIQAAGRLHDGRVYLVTEPIRGESLGARMARARLPIDEAMEILSQLAAAVADIHKAGVHRCDLGPDSVMVRHSEEGIEVKLLQVGLASLTRGSAPERHRGEEVGAPSDIHALGLLAQHMLVGTPVDQSLVVSEARPEVPAAVDHLVDAMLADDPRQRPTALDVHAAARKLAHALYRGTSVELPFRLQARFWLQKPKNRILLGAQLFIAVAGLLSYLFLRDGDSSDASAAPAEPAASETAPAPEPAPTPVPEKAAPTKAAPDKTAPAKPAEPVKVEPPKATEPPTSAPAKAAEPAKTAPAKAAVEPTKKKVEPTRPAEPAKKKEAAPKVVKPTPAPAAKAPATAPAAEPKRDRDAPIKDPFGDM